MSNASATCLRYDSRLASIARLKEHNIFVSEESLSYWYTIRKDQSLRHSKELENTTLLLAPAPVLIVLSMAEDNMNL